MKLNLDYEFKEPIVFLLAVCCIIYLISLVW